MGTDVDLPGEGPAGGGTGGAGEAEVGVVAVPDVQAARGGTDAERAGVLGRVGGATESSKQRERVVAVLQAVEVDVLVDRNTGQDPVPGGDGAGVTVDVDDDQTRRTARDTGPEVGVRGPPGGDDVLVEGGGVETVTPATGPGAGALGGGVRGLLTSRAVRGRCLAPRSQRMDRPPLGGTPAGDGRHVRLAARSVAPHGLRRRHARPSPLVQ